MMRMKVQPTVDGLCVNCRHGQVFEDVKGHVVAICNNLMEPFVVRRPVVRCTDYNDRRRQEEHDMRQIAWTLNTDKRGKVGFTPPVKKDE